LDVKEIKSGEELEKVKSNWLTLVDFGAPWCAPCHLQEPIIRQLASKFEGKVLVAEMNIDENRHMASMLGIRSIPTLILFRNGKEIQRFVGLHSEGSLSEAFKKILETG